MVLDKIPSSVVVATAACASEYAYWSKLYVEFFIEAISTSLPAWIEPLLSSLFLMAKFIAEYVSGSLKPKWCASALE